jgi:8-oxo-dGTP diphosphatase
MELKSSNIILYDSDERLLLQHRTWDAERLPGYWAFFGGGIKEEESPESAVRREALEEIGYTPIEPLLFVQQNFRIMDDCGYMYVFIEPFNGEKVELKLQEGQGWGWFNALETDNLKMIDHDRKIIKTLSNYLCDLYGR